MSTSTDGGLVLLDGITKSFQEGEHERTVLRDLHAEIQSGEFVVLMGRSGAGKSTLLNLISGIDLPTSGRVVIGDTDLTTLSETERTLFRREHIGFIFQSFNLISTLTVAENITLPLELAGRGDDKERAMDVLDRVGLADRADSFPDLLSGGEQQRVALARALAADPLLILADEPTGNLDYETGEQVMDVLTELVRDYGKTILIATHDRTLIAEADRCLTLHGGQLQDGVPDFVED
ncbi:ABC transporter ATP-binding protein [Longibacter salinarum]|nr:ABC transporter ATP-binding protein [Longibacter salinarum]